MNNRVLERLSNMGALSIIINRHISFMGTAQRILNIVNESKIAAKKNGHKGIILGLSEVMRDAAVTDFGHEKLEEYFGCEVVINPTTEIKYMSMPCIFYF
jgi:hypothetical protein